MENALVLTSDDIDMIAESLAVYCVFWFVVARVLWVCVSVALSRLLGREE